MYQVVCFRFIRAGTIYLYERTVSPIHSSAVAAAVWANVPGATNDTVQYTGKTIKQSFSGGIHFSNSPG